MHFQNTLLLILPVIPYQFNNERYFFSLLTLGALEDFLELLSSCRSTEKNQMWRAVQS